MGVQSAGVSEAASCRPMQCGHTHRYARSVMQCSTLHLLILPSVQVRATANDISCAMSNNFSTPATTAISAAKLNEKRPVSNLSLGVARSLRSCEASVTALLSSLALKPFIGIARTRTWIHSLSFSRFLYLHLPCCLSRAVLAELGTPTPGTPSPRSSVRYGSSSSVQTRAGSPAKPSDESSAVAMESDAPTYATLVFASLFDK